MSSKQRFRVSLSTEFGGTEYRVRRLNQHVTSLNLELMSQLQVVHGFLQPSHITAAVYYCVLLHAPAWVTVQSLRRHAGAVDVYRLALAIDLDHDSAAKFQPTVPDVVWASSHEVRTNSRRSIPWPAGRVKTNSSWLSTGLPT